MRSRAAPWLLRGGSVARVLPSLVSIVAAACGPATPSARPSAAPARGAGATSAVSTAAPSSSVAARADEPIDDAPLRAVHMQGAFVLRRSCSEHGDVVSGTLVDTRLPPASTFKIANTLIALETGVVTDPDATRPWDHVVRPIAAWNQDHDLRTAMRDSVVWFYQGLARDVGLERMRRFVSAFGYGNMKIGTRVDTFWLEGPLTISPREQVSFVGRALRQPGTEPLPGIAPRHLDTLRQIMPRQDHGAMAIRAKTGLYVPGEADWAAGGQAHGWLVGIVGPARDRTSTADCHQHVFALLLRADAARADEVRDQRWPVALEYLRRGGYLPR